jgi:hypothetical protein
VIIASFAGDVTRIVGVALLLAVVFAFWNWLLARLGTF